MFLAGAVGLGLLLFRVGPREVTLVYGVADPRVRTVEVVIARGDEVLRRADLRVLGDQPPSHRVDLLGDGPPRHVEKSITVAESGTLVIPLGP